MYIFLFIASISSHEKGQKYRVGHLNRLSWNSLKRRSKKGSKKSKKRPDSSSSSTSSSEDETDARRNDCRREPEYANYDGRRYDSMPRPTTTARSVRRDPIYENTFERQGRGPRTEEPQRAPSVKAKHPWSNRYWSDSESDFYRPSRGADERTPPSRRRHRRKDEK